MRESLEADSMSGASLTIWCNAEFPEPALTLLREGVRGHRLIFAAQRSASVLTSGAPDPTLGEADIAFGQPDPQSVLESPRISWVQLTTAGYTRYDTEQFRQGVASRGGKVSNSSQVFAEPCAEHALAFMLSQARQLPQSFEVQRGDRSWPSLPLRVNCRLLQGQSILLLGYGAIARRLVEMLAPFRMDVRVLRRQPTGEESGTVVAPEDLERALGEVDHVMNILPDNPATRQCIDSAKFAAMKPGAVFYNIGRGTTVDQEALLAALNSGRLAAAYLDVTEPEPLPPEHPLWAAPNCFITPHTAGGFLEEPEALVRHFLGNLERFVSGAELRDRII